MKTDLKIKIVKKTPLLKFIQKTDEFLFQISEMIILYFVKKNKYKYNKYKIMLFFKQINIALLILTMLFLTPLGIMFKNNLNTKELLTTQGILFFFFSLIIFFELLEYFTLKKKESIYNPLFLLRKYPTIYKLVKSVTMFDFIVKKKLRFNMIKTRFIIYGFFYLIIIPLNLSNGLGLEDSFLLYFIISHFLIVLNDYLDSIFDFDEPDKKRKKAKEKITDLVRKRLEELGKVCNPLPKPA